MLEFTFNVATAVIQILSMMSIMAPQVPLFACSVAVYILRNPDIAGWGDDMHPTECGEEPGEL